MYSQVREPQDSQQLLPADYQARYDAYAFAVQGAHPGMDKDASRLLARARGIHAFLMNIEKKDDADGDDEGRG